jgi:hypothetical protein
MNWDAISTIAEVVGAIGVIASLLYLAVQIRQGAKTAEGAAYRDASATICEELNTMSEGENGDIILKGLRKLSDLEPREKYTFDSVMVGFFAVIESDFISNDAELLSDETMENWGFLLRTRYLGYPGMQDWWQGSKQNFHQVDPRLDRSAIRPVGTEVRLLGNHVTITLTSDCNVASRVRHRTERLILAVRVESDCSAG